MRKGSIFGSESLSNKNDFLSEIEKKLIKLGLDNDSIENNKKKIKQVSSREADELGNKLIDYVWLMEEDASSKEEKALNYILNGANLNYVNYCDTTILNIATQYNHFNIVKTLLQYGVDAGSVVLNHEYSALMISVLYNKDNDILSLLLLMNPDINFTTKKGESALSLAIKKGKLEKVKVLLEAGADANICIGCSDKIEERRPVILRAIENRNIEMTGLLIKYGASIPPEDRNNFSDTDNLFMLEVTDYVFYKRKETESNDDAVSVLVKQAKSDLNKIMKK